MDYIEYKLWKAIALVVLVFFASFFYRLYRIFIAQKAAARNDTEAVQPDR